MDAATKRLVRQRAADRCEYCGMHQNDEPSFRYHIEHVIPKQHGGDDDPGNLALACSNCNFHKGPNLAGIDPVIFGKTPTGRVTVYVLNMNERLRVELRIPLKGTPPA